MRRKNIRMHRNHVLGSHRNQVTSWSLYHMVQAYRAQVNPENARAFVAEHEDPRDAYEIGAPHVISL